MRFPFPLSTAALAALISFVLAGSALARDSVRAVRPAPIPALRAAAEHYRSVTWTFERAARVHRTPTSFAYRRSADRVYLQWTVARWARRADAARNLALSRVRRRLSVAIPAPPAPHSRLSIRVAYSRRTALELRRIYPGTVSPGFARARARTGDATLRLWQKRLALEAVQVLRHGYARPPVPAALRSAFACIHRYEGAWTANTGNGYYGGLQMDLWFQRRYGAEYVRRWGTADNWPAWAQLATAARAYRSGRGFTPWPRTARVCGLA